MLARLKNAWRRCTPLDMPIYLFCYHKVGTTLLTKTWQRLCTAFGWRFREVFGQCERIPTDADVVLFAHSLVDLRSAPGPYVGAHWVRDPRDVIVSGYLYHRRCSEPWCLNTDFSTRPPIVYPRVPASQQHRPESWKAAYLASLGKRSYQQNLLQRSQREGLLFEMDHYGAWTIESMMSWDYGNTRIAEVRFEAAMSDYDGTFRALFERFGFSARQVQWALRLIAAEDLSRMTDRQLSANRHITSRQTTRWRAYFDDCLKRAFKERFGDALVRLGYETSEDWD
jgi:hypothetical protein